MTDPPGTVRTSAMSNLQVFLTDLRTNAWRTEGARFNAARRLRRRDWFATFSIGIFSAFGIGVSFVQKVYEATAGTPADKYLTALSVCLGLFVIVISLIEWGASGSVKAESLYQNAQELNAFQRKLAQVLAEIGGGRVLVADEVTEFREEYERIKGGCAHNHEPVDDQLFLAQQRFNTDFSTLFRRPKPSWLEATWRKAQSILSVVWYFGLFWIVVCGLLWVMPWSGI